MSKYSLWDSWENLLHWVRVSESSFKRNMGRSKDAQRTDQPFHGRIGARVIAERQYGVRSCTRPLYVDFVAGVVGDGPSFAARSEESALRYGQWQERQCQGHIKRKKLHDRYVCHAALVVILLQGITLGNRDFGLEEKVKKKRKKASSVSMEIHGGNRNQGHFPQFPAGRRPSD